MSLLTKPETTFTSLWGVPTDKELLAPIEIHSEPCVLDNFSLDDAYLINQDDKIFCNSVSPSESISSASDNGQDTYFSLEDVQDQRHDLHCPDPSLPLSCRFDPFQTLPLQLNRFQEQLVTSHLRGFQDAKQLSDHVGNNVDTFEPYIQMMTPAGFRITLARSALNRLSHKTYQDEDMRRNLEGAVCRYRTDASDTLQALDKTNNRLCESEELLESLIDLEKLEKKMGNVQLPSTHRDQLREVLWSSGGPQNIRSARLSRTMVHFECLYGTNRQSYVWNEIDFMQSLANINAFFSSIWTTWRSITQQYSLVIDEMKCILGPTATSTCFPSFIKDGSTIKEYLSRSADGRHGLSETDWLESTCQLTSLLTLCALVMDGQTEQPRLQHQLDEIHRAVDNIRLETLPNERIMRFLQTNLPDIAPQRLWYAAEHVWLLKHLSYNVRCLVRDWLLKFLTGQRLERCFKLDSFFFSYAS